MSTLLFSLQLAGPVSPSFSPVLPTKRCQVSDQGLQVVVQVLDGDGNPVNLRLASSLVILVVRPSGVGIEVPATHSTNGLDGQMQFTTGVNSPLGTGVDEVGIWQVQGKIKVDGDTQFTSVGAFSAGGNLGA